MAVAEASSGRSRRRAVTDRDAFRPQPIGEHVFAWLMQRTCARRRARCATERQFTIDELAERLALPRTTIYYWVRDMPIPGSGPGGEWPEAARRKGTLAMQRKYRLLREEAYQEGLEEYAALCIAIRRSATSCACISVRGTSAVETRVSICNSDPAVMVISRPWIQTARTAAAHIRRHLPSRSGARRSELRSGASFWACPRARSAARRKATAAGFRAGSGDAGTGSWRSPHTTPTFGQARGVGGSDQGGVGPGTRVNWTARGAWRSLVARGFWGAEVVGSNPTAPTAGSKLGGTNPPLATPDEDRPASAR